MNYKLLGFALVVIMAISYWVGANRQREKPGPGQERPAEEEQRLEGISNQEAQDRLIAWRKKAVPVHREPALTEQEIAEQYRARGMAPPLPVPTEEQMKDPVWRAGRIKEVKIERYYASAAKDTEACKAVVTLLKKDDLGLDAVGDAYNIAWENQRAGRMMQGMPEDEAASTWRVIAGRWVDKFKEEFPTVSENTLAALYEIKPEVFYGNPVLDMAQPQPYTRP